MSFKKVPAFRTGNRLVPPRESALIIGALQYEFYGQEHV